MAVRALDLASVEPEVQRHQPAWPDSVQHESEIPKVLRADAVYALQTRETKRCCVNSVSEKHDRVLKS